jgi:hypothetical protein
MAAVANLVDITGINDIISKLCEINGDVEYGIAAGVDPSLPESSKLVVPAVDAVAEVKDKWAQIVGQSAIGICFAKGWTDENVQKIVLSSALAMYKSGMIGVGSDVITVKELVDLSKVQIIPDTAKDKVVKVWTEAIKPENISIGALCFTATKVGMFAMNHHVGSNGLQGFPRKVVTSVVLSDSSPTEESINKYKDPLHMLGHWASTCRVFRHLGFGSVSPEKIVSTVAEPEEGQKIRLTATRDVTMRACRESVPAGASTFGLAIAILKRLFRHPMVVFCPGIAEMALLAEKLSALQADPLKAHVGSRYFTGVATDTSFNDEATSTLGRLGSFICTTSPNSSLAKSPHLSQNRFKEFEDYDPNWHNLLNQFRTASVLAPDTASKILGSLTGSLTVGNAPTISPQSLQILGVTQNSFGEKYRIAFEATKIAPAAAPQVAQIQAVNTAAQAQQVVQAQPTSTATTTSTATVSTTSGITNLNQSGN